MAKAPQLFTKCHCSFPQITREHIPPPHWYSDAALASIRYLSATVLSLYPQLIMEDARGLRDVKGILRKEPGLLNTSVEQTHVTEYK